MLLGAHALFQHKIVMPCIILRLVHSRRLAMCCVQAELCGGGDQHACHDAGSW